jgi:hypothetical protein
MSWWGGCRKWGDACATTLLPHAQPHKGQPHKGFPHVHSSSCCNTLLQGRMCVAASLPPTIPSGMWHQLEVHAAGTHPRFDHTPYDGLPGIGCLCSPVHLTLQSPTGCNRHPHRGYPRGVCCWRQALTRDTNRRAAPTGTFLHAIWRTATKSKRERHLSPASPFRTSQRRMEQPTATMCTGASATLMCTKADSATFRQGPHWGGWHPASMQPQAIPTPDHGMGSSRHVGAAKGHQRHVVRASHATHCNTWALTPSPLFSPPVVFACNTHHRVTLGLLHLSQTHNSPRDIKHAS